MGKVEESACCAMPQVHNRRHSYDGAADWSHGNSVGNYSNGEALIENDSQFNTPFAGGRDLIGRTFPVQASIAGVDDAAELPVEAGRYRLLWTALCPYATRVKIVLNLLGIGEDVISTGLADPVRTTRGWLFSLDPDGKDPVLGIHALPEIYEETLPGGAWRATVPTLVDVKERKVVNNDYHHLPYYLETVWRPYWRDGAPDLYPAAERTQIDRLNRILFNEVEDCVYRAGFATTQETYERNYYMYFARLDMLERHLATHRFLMGDHLTDADVRLYAALARLDCAYYYTFRLNRQRLRDYNHLWSYMRELYSIPAFREATDWDAIKRGYYLGDTYPNPWRIVPDGPDQSVWDAPNDRAARFGTTLAALGLS